MKLAYGAGCVDIEVEVEDVGKTFRIMQPGWNETMEDFEVEALETLPGPSTFTVGDNALLPVGNRPQGWPQECQEERCSYFVHYLRHSRLGEKDISHAAYHVAEKQCLEAQERLQELEDQGKDTPAMVNHVLKLEREVRA